MSLQAQVKIGKDVVPEKGAILDLNSKTQSGAYDGYVGGLLLPNVNIELDKISIAGTDDLTKLEGMIVYSLTPCPGVYVWDGSKWEKLGEPCPPEPLPRNLDNKGGDTWSTTKWVGAFWRQDETGERIIASKNTTAWSASVDAPCDWLVLEANGGFDPELWTDNPGDAEAYQLSGSSTSVSGTGNILFRIGAKSVNPNVASADYKLPNNNNGKAPRYATVTLTVNGNDSKIFCRQGEAADYVFTSDAIDNYNDPDATAGTNVRRDNARKFSPYNLTDAALTESVLSHQAGYQGGSFVDFPTKAGAFFQWGQTENITYAYHPTNPSSGTPTGWSTSYYTYNNWDNIKFTQETCPDTWRRPNDGVTNVKQEVIRSIDYTANNIYISDMRQSLYAVPKNGTVNMSETTGRAWGYYADGYFDRRKITEQNSSWPNTTVSPNTKDVAYLGTLFFNAANDNRSLFAPAAGYRSSGNPSLINPGLVLYYITSSAAFAMDAWYLNGIKAYVRQGYTNKNYGYSVRCVSEY
jgi:hypothetical protein